MKTLAACTAALALWTAPANAHESRTDACGCHHQFGLRHCHPKKKTLACTASVKAKLSPKAGAKQVPPRL